MSHLSGGWERCYQIGCLVKPCSLLHRWGFLLCHHLAEEARLLPPVSFIMVLIPLKGVDPHDLITSQRAHLLLLSHWKLDFNTWIGRRTPIFRRSTSCPNEVICTGTGVSASASFVGQNSTPNSGDSASRRGKKRTPDRNNKLKTWSIPASSDHHLSFSALGGLQRKPRK